MTPLRIYFDAPLSRRVFLKIAAPKETDVRAHEGEWRAYPGPSKFLLCVVPQVGSKNPSFGRVVEPKSEPPRTQCLR